MTRSVSSVFTNFATALLLLSTLLPTLATSAAEFDSEKLAQVRTRMQKFVDQNDVSGLVVVVGNAQGIVLHEALGQSNLERKEPMAKDAIFRIASMTKPITALGIMQLVDDGKLTIDDPVEKHLPEFKGQMIVLEKQGDKVTLGKPERPITLKDLLTHTSGLPAFPPGIADIYFRRKHTLAEMTFAISQRPLDFQPGSKWAYCNPGIDTLGRVIEVVSGESFEAFMQRRVFAPLGMNDTSFYLDPQKAPRLATLYGKQGNQLVDAKWVLIGPTEGAKHPIPAGGLFSTGNDLAKLYQCFLKHGELNGQRIISTASFKLMTTNHTGEMKAGFTPGICMGLGWQMVREPQGVTAMLKPGTYGHGGAFGTQGWIDPEQDFFNILLIQRNGLQNGDASALRMEMQLAVTEAMRK